MYDLIIKDNYRDSVQKITTRHSYQCHHVGYSVLIASLHCDFRTRGAADQLLLFITPRRKHTEYIHNTIKLYNYTVCWC